MTDLPTVNRERVTLTCAYRSYVTSFYFNTFDFRFIMSGQNFIQPNNDGSEIEAALPTTSEERADDSGIGLDDLSQLVAALDLHNSIPTFETTRIRWMVANHPNTPASVLVSMIETMPVAIVRRIAEHPSLSEQALISLCEHHDGEVRVGVVDNCSTPRHIIERLVADQCIDVRYAIAANYDIDQDLLVRLLDDDNPYVVQRARQTLRRLDVSECVAFPGTYEERDFPFRKTALG